VEVYVLRIMDLRRDRSSDRINVCSKMDSVDELLYDFVDANWDTLKLGSLDGYDDFEALQKFFTDFKSIYQYNVDTQIIQGGVEGDDWDTVELVPDEVAVVRRAVYTSRYEGNGDVLGLSNKAYFDFVTSVREKLK